MHKVITRDGSITFFNEGANEHYHALTGAFEEAELKHVAPAKEYFFDGCTICDFCYGLGYNSFAALAFCEEQGYASRLFVLENDLSIIQELQNIELPPRYVQYGKDILSLLETEGKVVSENPRIVLYEKVFGMYTLTFFLGDARESIKLLPEKVDVLFFDPFSLRKQPYMWEQEVFDAVFTQMNAPSILTTYSCSRVVRERMATSGFKVLDGPVVGRRAPGTLALKD